MTDYQNNRTNQLFHFALNKLNIRFPVAEIHRNTGAGKGNISNYIKNKVSVSNNFLKKFADSYNINLDELAVELANDKNQSITPKNGLTFTEIGNGQFSVAVPLIPFEAHARYLSEQQDADFFDDFESVTFIVDKVGFGNYRAFKVKGDSMNDGHIIDTQDGAIVLARELQQHHWHDGFRPTDYGWILITQHNILFKDIIGFDITIGEITCHSRNSSPEYSDFQLSLNEVFQIFKVIKRMF
ncbi:MAG: hypothetical protein HRT68_06105 [Flavobacteriaceae bacterium]|nr:hypothetical protein [Flavobacteriaceae bacterium]